MGEGFKLSQFFFIIVLVVLVVVPRGNSVGG